MVVVVVEVVRPATRRGGDGRGGGGEHEGGVPPYGGGDVRLGRRYERHSPWAANYWRCDHEAGGGGRVTQYSLLVLCSGLLVCITEFILQLSD